MYNYNNLCDEFLQYKKYLGYKYNTEKIIINEIKKFLIDNNVDIITKEITEKYARININRNSNGIARNMGVLKEFCKYLKMQDIECYQIPNKIYSQKIHNLVPYIFSHEEIKLIINNSDKLFNYHISYYNRIILPIIIRILYQTGMRIGEVLNLKIKDYNYKDKLFHLHNTKNGQERLIYLPDNLNNIILKYHNKFNYNHNIDDKLFNISYSTVNKYFYRILNKSNIKRKENSPRLHDLRHTFIVYSIEKAINEGKDINNFINILQVYVGHESVQSLEYYFKITNAMLNDINKISEEKFGYLIPNVEEVKDYE